MSARRRFVIVGIALILLAAALRLYGVGWGLPVIYEEATPLRVAWSMANWGEPKPLDLNPHFFNYPSLTFYLQLAAHGAMYGALRIAGAVESPLDYRVLYLLDKTPFVLIGRLISVLFALATVWLVYTIGRRIGGLWVGAPAAFLLAINTFHISRSQMIEVDLPLTFFVTLALLCALRLTETPKPGNYLLAGLAMGLAASTKYTGALLVVPLLAAEVIVLTTGSSAKPWRRRLLDRRRWLLFGGTLVTAAVVFAVTSPYVFIDSRSFLQHLDIEREHMRIGHFGLEAQSTLVFYTRSLMGKTLGWPLAILAVAGTVYSGILRRRRWAIVLAAFVVPYFLTLNSWSMMADRYLLPMIPGATVLALGALNEILESDRLRRLSTRARVAVLVAVTILASVPAIVAMPEHLKRTRNDTRSVAKVWIQKNIPSGSLIALEHYGPELFATRDLAILDEETQKRIIEGEDSPVYALQSIPMVQTKPERSASFYDLSLYTIADYIVTSGSVRSRYSHDPERFVEQMAFYDSLDTSFDLVYEVTPEGGAGPVISIYKNRMQTIPFSKRGNVPGPVPLPPSSHESSRKEGLFYYNLGLNYEMAGYVPQALASYDIGLKYYAGSRAVIQNQLVVRKTAALVALGRAGEALEFLDVVDKVSPTQQHRETVAYLRQWVRNEMAKRSQ